MKINYVHLSKTPMIPNDFIKTAYRIFGRTASDIHNGNISSNFSYCLKKGTILVTWGILSQALHRTKLPVKSISVPVPLPHVKPGKALVVIHHTTPTLLKQTNGPKIPWFDPEAYIRALSGALSVAGLPVKPEEIARQITFESIKVETTTWDTGRWIEKGFIGNIKVRIPMSWLNHLQLLELLGLGCRRGWGMGNIEIKASQRKVTAC